MRVQRWAPWVVRWSAPALAAIALWASVPMWRFSAEAIRYPFQLDPIESKVLQHALWLGEDHPIYFALDSEPPWVVGNYTPLFPLLCAIGVDPTLSDFAWPRTLTLLSTLAAGLVLAGAVWRTTHSVALALLGAGLWWSTYEVYFWAPLCRIDLPALALGAGGLLVGLCSLRRWSWPRLVAACVLFWLAWLTRQTQVLFPLALVGWMAVSDRRWAWRLALVWGVGLAALIAVLCITTGGQFWVLTVRCNVNVWHWDQMRIWIHHLTHTMWPFGLVALVVGSAAAILTSGRGGSAGREGAGVVGLALALNLLNVIATGKVGADKNYLLEPLWCLCALLPVLWHRMSRFEGRESRVEKSWHRSAWASVFTVFTACLVVQTLWGISNPRAPAVPWREGLWVNRRNWRPRISQRDRLRDIEVDGEMRRAEGPVLCEYGIYALRSGRELIHEPFLMSRLAQEGLWDETPLLDRIRRCEFGLIVVEDNLADPDALLLSATPEFAAAVRESHVLERTWPGVITLHLWRPRPDQGPVP